jgi:formiminoglutamase
LLKIFNTIKYFDAYFFHTFVKKSQMLHYWLKPVATKIADASFENDTLGKQVVYFNKTMTDISGFDVALLGIHAPEADAVRAEFYRLSSPEGNIKIIDVGNLRNLETATIIAVVKELLAGKILPILLGGALPITYQLLRAYEDELVYVNTALVDEAIRVFPRSQHKDDKNTISHIVSIKSPKISAISIIGYQLHFTPQAAVQFCNEQHIECIRLGKVHADMEALEPIIRDADTMSFNLTSIRASDAPAQTNASPSGFFLEEACQIARYAGMSDKMTSFFVYGYEVKLDVRQQTAQAIAQLCWYFLEGFYQRKHDFPLFIAGLMEYIVNYKSTDFQLAFWKSNASGRWWMQIPTNNNATSSAERHYLISCTYKDYEAACNGELPERLMNALQRFA